MIQPRKRERKKRTEKRKRKTSSIASLFEKEASGKKPSQPPSIPRWEAIDFISRRGQRERLLTWEGIRQKLTGSARRTYRIQQLAGIMRQLKCLQSGRRSQIATCEIVHPGNRMVSERETRENFLLINCFFCLDRGQFRWYQGEAMKAMTATTTNHTSSEVQFTSLHFASLQGKAREWEEKIHSHIGGKIIFLIKRAERRACMPPSPLAVRGSGPFPGAAINVFLILTIHYVWTSDDPPSNSIKNESRGCGGGLS